MENPDMKHGFTAPGGGPGAPRPASGADRQPFVAKMVAKVASNACTSLAIIAVLVVLVVGMFVYYHGFLFMGPYAKRAVKCGAKSSAKKSEKPADKDSDSEKGDSETERLIESINSA
jgi:hypothetical protein